MIKRSNRSRRSRRLQSSPSQQKLSLEAKKSEVKRTSNTISVCDTKIAGVTRQKRKNIKSSHNMSTKKRNNSIKDDDSKKTKNKSKVLSPSTQNNINGSRYEQAKTRDAKEKEAKQGDTKFESSASSKGINKKVAKQKSIKMDELSTSEKVLHKRSERAVKSRPKDKTEKVSSKFDINSKNNLKTNSNNSSVAINEVTKKSRYKEEVAHEMTKKTLKRINSAGLDELSHLQKKVPRISPKRTGTFKKYGEETEKLSSKFNIKSKTKVDLTMKSKNDSKTRTERRKEEVPHKISEYIKAKKDMKQTKKTSTKTLKRFNSASSNELPIFQEKVQRKSPKQPDTFKKYEEETEKVGSKFNIKSKTKADLTTENKNGSKTRTERFKKDVLHKIKAKKDMKHTKKTSTKTLKRFNSASSDELPLFRRKSPKQTETFKKYGVIVPLIDEIIADQQQLSNYKDQLKEVQALREPIFKMPVSPKKNKIEELELLDCKHLSLEDITRYFKDNIPFLSGIMTGKENSYRHQRYFNKISVRDSFTVKDLTYNTSTIVFSFEQLDHMVSLMRKQFDPNDDKASYFFKVLAPELCLKIFMDTHDMSKREANSYLDNRPL